MSFKDILIVGPTSSGKTDLAGSIAGFCDLPICNCDAVQIYKDLDVLTNKPQFLYSKDTSFGPISYSSVLDKVNPEKWKDFTFKVIEQGVKSGLNFVEFDNEILFFDLLEQYELFNTNIEQGGKLSQNFLFNQKNPLNQYSLSDWKADLSSIVENLGITSKIVVGGTIYYAYHYLFGTEFGEYDPESNEKMIELRNELQEESLENLINFLTEKDPESLNFVDTRNKQRVIKAVEFIKRSGEKFSKHYFKKTNILSDFLVIMIIPKVKEKYYQKLDQIVEDRFNEKAREEIEFLIQKYGSEVEPWLQKVSYEYKFALEWFKGERSKEVILQELKFAERHYAKRQMAFMRKMEKDLLKIRKKS